eukprot:435575-Amphidinium_carterae.1
MAGLHISRISSLLKGPRAWRMSFHQLVSIVELLMLSFCAVVAGAFVSAVGRVNEMAGEGTNRVALSVMPLPWWKPPFLQNHASSSSSIPSLQSEASLTCLSDELELLVFPNVGALHGQLLFRLAAGSNLQDIKAIVGRGVLSVEVTDVQLYRVDAEERVIDSLRGLVSASERGGVIATRLGVPRRIAQHSWTQKLEAWLVLRLPCELLPRGSKGLDYACTWSHGWHCEASSSDHEWGARRYDERLVGGQVQRISSKEVDAIHLLRCQVPVVLSDTELLGGAPEHWTFECPGAGQKPHHYGLVTF